mgnify:FL=1
MKITNNFSLGEMIKSSTAIRQGIDNSPNTEHLINLTNLCCNILQPVSNHFKRTVTINSGYRSPSLNKAIGGSKTSHHCFGEAADFEIIGLSNVELATWIKNNLMFDQLILEFHIKGQPNSGWVHCSYKKDKTNRKKIMTALRVGKKTVYKLGLIN